MAEKLNAENIEAAVQHLENIQTGKTPILSELEGHVNKKKEQVEETVEDKNIKNQPIKKNCALETNEEFQLITKVAGAKHCLE